jgi:DNA-binding protein
MNSKDKYIPVVCWETFAYKFEIAVISQSNTETNNVLVKQTIHPIVQTKAMQMIAHNVFVSQIEIREVKTVENLMQTQKPRLRMCLFSLANKGLIDMQF